MERACSALPAVIIFSSFFSFSLFACVSPPVPSHQSGADHGDGLRFVGVSRASTNNAHDRWRPWPWKMQGIHALLHNEFHASTAPT